MDRRPESQKSCRATKRMPRWLGGVTFWEGFGGLRGWRTVEFPFRHFLLVNQKDWNTNKVVFSLLTFQSLPSRYCSELKTQGRLPHLPALALAQCAPTGRIHRTAKLFRKMVLEPTWGPWQFRHFFRRVMFNVWWVGVAFAVCFQAFYLWLGQLTWCTMLTSSFGQKSQSSSKAATALKRKTRKERKKDWGKQNEMEEKKSVNEKNLEASTWSGFGWI